MGKFLKILFAALFLSMLVFGQKANYFKRVFVDAEYYFLYEEYKDALPLYLEIFATYPDNANISYRIGVCYLNIPNEKHKSITFLEKALNKVSANYREGYFTEGNAPREVFKQYGNALRIVGNFDKALLAYATYRSMLSDHETSDLQDLDRQVQAISFAINMKTNPVPVTFTSVGRTINTRFAELNPMLTFDGRTMVYTSRQQFYNAILLSQLVGEEWLHPVNLNSQMLADGPIMSVGIASDGKTIVMSRNDNDDYNLYTSTFDANRKAWLPMVRLPKEINTRHWENYGSFTYRSDTLYFSSNRPEGYGGYDIYFSVKTATGWSTPVNMGGTINTPFDDIAPYITTDSKKLFFASKGHPGMGGYDLFVSQKRSGHWTEPVNLGYPINTTDDDEAFFPVGNGRKGLISRLRTETNGEEDIYWVDFEPEPEGEGKGPKGLSSSPMTHERGTLNTPGNSMVKAITP